LKWNFYYNSITCNAYIPGGDLVYIYISLLTSLETEQTSTHLPVLWKRDIKTRAIILAFKLLTVSQLSTFLLSVHRISTLF